MESKIRSPHVFTAELNNDQPTAEDTNTKPYRPSVFRSLFLTLYMLGLFVLVVVGYLYLNAQMKNTTLKKQVEAVRDQSPTPMFSLTRPPGYKGIN